MSVASGLQSWMVTQHTTNFMLPRWFYERPGNRAPMYRYVPYWIYPHPFDEKGLVYSGWNPAQAMVGHTGGVPPRRRQLHPSQTAGMMPLRPRQAIRHVGWYPVTHLPLRRIPAMHPAVLSGLTGPTQLHTFANLPWRHRLPDQVVTRAGAAAGVTIVKPVRATGDKSR